MLSKFSYESIPYACLSLGGVSIVSVENVLGFVAGVSLYALGALVWTMRFHNRHPVQINLKRRGITLPVQVYEFKPFIFFVCSLFLFSFYSNAWAIGIGLAMIVHSIYILFKRYQNRTYVSV